MEKIKREKKLILTGIALLLAVIGTSFAWWTSRYTIEQEVNMGRLTVVADIPAVTEIDNYEPGTSLEKEGTIKNTGSISAMIKINNNSLIRMKYFDDNMTPIPVSQQKFEKDNENAIKLDLKPLSGLYNDPNNQLAFWFKDGNDNTYLLLDPGSSVEVINEIYFDGNVMGEKYQDANIQVKTDIVATQVLDGALLKEFGITSSDLVGLDDSGSRMNSNKAEERLKELINR